MKTQPMTVALLSVALSYAVPSLPVKAAAPDQETGAYVSALPPIYPASEQQSDTTWRAREIMRCPDGYKLSFEDQTPNCMHMTAQELAGNIQMMGGLR